MPDEDSVDILGKDSPLLWMTNLQSGFGNGISTCESISAAKKVRDSDVTRDDCVQSAYFGCEIV
ncbi:hypothetical protein ASF22_22685 [Methylobacterium sp. Leaf87]|uniref:hypothetical protein n=1 Tax=Methylobacterium sp. Leaf87 TaxID=1736243 RepID=UPI0006F6E941|nr:hypothetical protein [Methylobacterium sp. Leaf87]KQO57356.1 hypothetical protein ASF22_22685 [Methylobacterium sp. Leaf87]